MFSFWCKVNGIVVNIGLDESFGKRVRDVYELVRDVECLCWIKYVVLLFVEYGEVLYGECYFGESIEYYVD